MRTSIGRTRTQKRFTAVALVLWLAATLLLAAAPLLYFASGTSDSATDGIRIAYAACPLLLAWAPLAGALGLIRKRRTGRWGLPFGAAGRRAALLVLSAAGMLAVARKLAAESTIYGNGAWVLFWLGSVTAWVALCFACARSPHRHPPVGQEAQL